MKKMETKSWIEYIKQRIRNNKNFLAIISGATGSGKSFSALSIAEQLDPEFNINRVVFGARDLMKIINSGQLKKGSAILWDEAQIDLSSRNWQSLMNKTINYLITTFRHRNFILLFTSPYSDFLDSATSKLFHADFRTKKIDKRNQCVVLNPKSLEYNDQLKKFYRKHLIVVKLGIGKIKIKRWSVARPSKELVESYEKKKTEFTDALNKQIEYDLDRIESKTKPLTQTQHDYLALYEKFGTETEVAKFLGVSVSNVSQRIRAAKIKLALGEQKK